MSLEMIVYNKDSTCMEEIDAATIDLIITSPPYWNLKDYNHPKQLGRNQTYKHFFYLLKRNFIECMRVLKEDSFICLVVGDIRTGKYKTTGRPRLYSMQSTIIEFFTEEMDFDLFQHFIWQKFGVKKGEKESLIRGSVCQGDFKDFGVPPFLYTDLLTEHILVFRKPGIRSRGNLKDRQEVAMNLIPKIELQEWLNPVWKINSPPNSEHEATFPDELVKRLIKMFSLVGDLILDPFAGTGTTLRNAIRSNRNSIGYELNAQFLEGLAKDYSLKREGAKLYNANILEN